MNHETETISLPKKITRLVVLGDPHGDLRGLLGVLEREGGDAAAFVSVGDNVGYADGPTSSRLCEELMRRRIPSVIGNHEEWMDNIGRLAMVHDGENWILSPKAFEWSRSLPYRIRFIMQSAPHLSVSVVHSLKSPIDWKFIKPVNVSLLKEQENTDLVFCGHSHGPKIFSEECIRLNLLKEKDQASVDLTANQQYVVDAGSMGRPAYFPDPMHLERATYAVLDIKKNSVTIRSFKKKTVRGGQESPV